MVRHGKIELEDEQRRYVGQIDLPLAAEGRKQAENLGRRFEHADLGAIYCSDLVRSLDTAEIIARRARAQVVPRADLREVSMGAWEGLAFREIARRFPMEYKARGEAIATFRVPGGESFADCSGRIVPAFREIAEESEENILVVGHAGANRLLLCHLLGMPLQNLFRLGQDYGCLNIIQRGSTGYQVRLINGRGRWGRR